MKPERPPDLLSRTSLLRLLAVMLLVISPHLLRLPAWESALVLSIAAWRGAAAVRQWPMPHALLKVALTLAIFAGVYASYGRVWGQNAGVALLVVMLALKLTELRERRDVMVTVFLLYFLLVTHFLYSQAPWTVLYLLLSTVAITAVLIDVHHAGHARPLPMTLGPDAVAKPAADAADVRAVSTAARTAVDTAGRRRRRKVWAQRHDDAGRHRPLGAQ